MTTSPPPKRNPKFSPFPSGMELQAKYPKSVLLLFLFFGFYIAVPVLDVPFWGLSLSAPVFFLIALQVFIRPPQFWITSYRVWIMLAVAIWLGIFLSATLNGLVSSGVRSDGDTFISLIRFAYWLLVFVVTVYLLSSQSGWTEKMALVLVAGIFFLGLLRLSEVIVGDAFGAWSNLRFMTQNSYGIQFSTFFPLLFSFIYFGKHRIFAVIGALFTLSAILINGSRSNWLAVVLSLLVLMFMILTTLRQRLRSAAILFSLAGFLVLGMLFAPQPVISAFEQRLGTFQNLEADKPYAIRQLMVKKGLQLFRSSPLIGIGISRWRKESLPLEIPLSLSYAPQSHFDVKSSHNSYVSFLAENGLMGIIPYGILLLILIVRGYSAARHLAQRGQVWALGIYASFIGMSIHLWSLSGLTGSLPWFIYGMVAGLIVLDQESSPKPETRKNARMISFSHLRPP